jgi:hypothetical protein
MPVNTTLPATAGDAKRVGVALDFNGRLPVVASTTR